MAKRVANHLHKYKKVNLSRNPGRGPFIVFKCVKPACSHHIPFNLAEGKLCECYRCGEPMILNKIAIQLVKPHCGACIKRKINVDSIAEFLEKTPIS